MGARAQIKPKQGTVKRRVDGQWVGMEGGARSRTHRRNFISLCVARYGSGRTRCLEDGGRLDWPPPESPQNPSSL